MIDINNISKSFGNLIALNAISFRVEKGSIVGILGPNGAGKTTLFKILTELIKPSTGNFNIHSQKQKSIGAIIENPHLYEYLNGAQNLKVFARYQGLKLSTRQTDDLLINVGLDPMRKDQVKNYSLGMKQRLGIATALLNDPDALILDEPFLGLDPIGMQDLREMLKSLAKDKGMAILISSHQLEELSKVCQELYLINKGRITASGPTADILHRATQKFKISGRGIAESSLLNDFKVESLGDLLIIDATKAEATKLMRQLIKEGHEINEFGPVLNLQNIYQD